ncbi:hypothetical protein B4135_4216 [Caldibacillus debilis]|uniref:Uncharacterized protein n=1 Tax=Caldibacillus debilis TaxID=301148 RepID=A0A150L7N5_9BACI|nr:hypothetical protein B4135_4216 [Caldibacillus debilis]
MIKIYSRNSLEIFRQTQEREVSKGKFFPSFPRIVHDEAIQLLRTFNGSVVSGRPTKRPSLNQENVDFGNFKSVGKAVGEDWGRG